MQCCGSMTVWCGSGSADPCLLVMDPNPNLAPLVRSQVMELREGSFEDEAG